MPEQPDGIDIAHLEQAVRMDGYRLIADRLESICRSKLIQLRNAKGDVESERIRGFLDGIERALGIPDSLRAEHKARKERG